MTEMNRRLDDDDDLAERYAAAHRAYLADRAALGEVPEIAGVSAGGMPDRVKCLHALVGHALAAGPGVNPLGDEALADIGEFWARPAGRARDESGGRGDRLRHQLHPAADRRSRPPGRPAASWSGGRRSSDSVRAWTPPVSSIPTRCPGPSPQPTSTPKRSGPPACRRTGSTSWPRRPPGTRGTGTSSSTGSSSGWGSRRTSISGDGRGSALLHRSAQRRARSRGIRLLVMDIGGGSTELILGHGDDAHRPGHLARRRLGPDHRAFPEDQSHPARSAGGGGGVRRRAAWTTPVSTSLARRTWIGVAGTMTTLAGVFLGLDSYDRTKVHGAVLSVGRSDRAARSTGGDDRGGDQGHPVDASRSGRRDHRWSAGRQSGSASARRRSRANLTISESDILDGIALELLEG